MRSKKKKKTYKIYCSHKKLTHTIIQLTGTISNKKVLTILSKLWENNASEK